MQQIKSKEQIQQEDVLNLQRIILAEERHFFQQRANRLRQLAQGHELSQYLRLVAAICEAQEAVMGRYETPALSDEKIQLAQKNAMPPLHPSYVQRDGAWRAILEDLLSHLTEHALHDDIPALAQAQIKDLLAAVEQAPERLEAIADKVLADEETDAAAAPFIMAALQVYWRQWSLALGYGNLPVVNKSFGVCPCCGALPVSSVVHVGEQQGVRYLSCSLCSTQWHLVRVICSTCQGNKEIHYHQIEGQSKAIKAESCGECGTYRKIFYQDEDLYVDPVADDLASLHLDQLMADAGFERASGNPFLW